MAWTIAGNLKGPQGDPGAAGADGPQGPTGPQGPAGVSGLEWQGAYDPATAYTANQTVGYLGATYFATADHAAATATPAPSTSTPPPSTGQIWPRGAR